MSVQTISPSEVHRRQAQGQAIEIIDVRTPAEYASVHATGAQSVPLDELDVRNVMSNRLNPDQPLYVICRTGSRATKACEKFLVAGFTNVLCVEGGTVAWEEAHLPVVRGRSKVISLDRQVRIAVGSFVLLGLVLGWFVHPGFYLLSAFMGAGLVMSGITDWCGVAMLIAKMPWNQAPREQPQ